MSGWDDPVARIRELEAEVTRLRDVVERVKGLEPTWYRGMYGCPDDMFSRISLTRAMEDRP